MNISIGILTGMICLLCWGTADFFATQASRKVGYFKTVFWAHLIAFFLALIYPLFIPQNFNLSLWAILLLALAGFLQAIALMFFYRGLEIGLVSVVSPIASSYSMIVVLLGIFLLKEQLTLLQTVGILLIFIGVPLVSINLNEIKKAEGHVFQKGTRESFLSMLFWGVAFFLLSPVVRENGWFWPTVIDAFFVVFFLYIYGVFLKIDFLVKDKSSLLPIFSDGLLTIIGYFAFSIGLLYSLVSIVTPISTIFPVVTIILAWIFFREKLGGNQIFGIAAVIGGLVVLSL